MGDSVEALTFEKYLNPSAKIKNLSTRLLALELLKLVEIR
jgi:hypothetical protein